MAFICRATLHRATLHPADVQRATSNSFRSKSRQTFFDRTDLQALIKHTLDVNAGLEALNGKLDVTLVEPGS